MNRRIALFFLCLLPSAILLAQENEIDIISTMTGRMTTSDGANHTYWGFGYPSMPPVIQLPGPMMILHEGTPYTLNLTNNSMEDHTVHLHGLDVDQANDGFPETSFSIRMGRTGTYRFTAPHAGTYWYHCHVESFLHAHMGMYGAIIVRPPDGSLRAWDGGPAFDIERCWLVSEFDSLWLRQTMDADFKYYRPKYFMINGKEQAELETDASATMEFTTKETVLLRLINAGYMLYRFDFGDLNATAVASDGRPLPSAIEVREIDVLPGERYDVLLRADTPGDRSISVSFLTLYAERIAHTLNVPVRVTGATDVSQPMSPDAFEVAISPSPFSRSARGIITISALSSGTGYSLRIRDVLGRSVGTLMENAAIPEGKTVIPFEVPASLSAGVYFLELGNARTSVKKTFTLLP